MVLVKRTKDHKQFNIAYRRVEWKKGDDGEYVFIESKTSVTIKQDAIVIAPGRKERVGGGLNILGSIASIVSFLFQLFKKLFG